MNNRDNSWSRSDNSKSKITGKLLCSLLMIVVHSYELDKELQQQELKKRMLEMERMNDRE